MRDLSVIQELPKEELSTEEIKYLITHYKFLSRKYTNFEQAVKTSANSAYGAFGNKWFYFFDVDIAQAITSQGKDAILYAEKIINMYFNDFFHEDTKVHNHFNIRVKNKLQQPAVIYIDTDSCYIQFGEMYNNIEWLGEKLSIDDFILEMFNFRLNDYIEKCLDKYSKLKNCDANYLILELESIALNGIWMSKKQYIQNLMWDDKLGQDQRHENLSKIKSIGFETVMSSTPKFVRDKLPEALRILFQHTDQPTGEDLDRLVSFLKKTKKEFKLCEIDEISFNKKTNNLSKYILDDQQEFQIAQKTPPNVKGAGFYNFLLNNNSKYKQKYKHIGDGEKLKMYHINHPLSDTFCFLPAAYPYEIAPSIDYDKQFEKTMIDPINRLLKVIGLQELDVNLLYATSLF
jgi:DNA polymerase elongation subunit (family B)